LVLGGEDLVVSHDPGDPLYWGAFVMAPWTSVLRGAEFEFDGVRYDVSSQTGVDAEHGLVRRRAWRRLSDALETDLLGWPFAATVRLEPTVSESAMKLRMSVTAIDQPTPAAIGWHPWFRTNLGRGGNVVVQLPPDSLMQHRDPAGVPTGRWVSARPYPWDDCFRVTSPVRLTWPQVGELRIITSADFLTIFTPARGGVCVEPVTSPAERMDRVLGPGESLDLDITLEWVPGLSTQ
jgi:aldose 1-epimerase